MLESERYLIKANLLHAVVGLLLEDSDENIAKIREINEKEFLSNEDIKEIDKLIAINEYCYKLGDFLNELIKDYMDKVDF